MKETLNKIMNQKWIAVFCAMIIVFSLTSCSSDGGEEENSSNAAENFVSASAESTTEAESTAEVESAEISDEAAEAEGEEIE